MSELYLRTLQTAGVEAVQMEAYGKVNALGNFAAEVDELGGSEISFIRDRDSFYMGSVGESGWPYVQHRGGKKGFLRVIDSRRLAFADLRGNRQLISTGNVGAESKVSLFLMDYKARERLKIIGRASVLSEDEAVAFSAEHLMEIENSAPRVFVIDVVAYDWNCPKYITPRFTREEVEEVVMPLRRRIQELEEIVRSCELNEDPASR